MDIKKDKDGFYLISNADELYWFAGLVNGTLTGVTQNKSANAKLTENIVVNESDVAGYDGTSDVDWKQWTPIGYYLDSTHDVAYTGTFDGQEHTISGLYFNNTSKSYVGLFGQTGSVASIQNVGVVNSYIKGHDHVGGVCGFNNGTITNCYNTGTVSGGTESYDVGGVCGFNYYGTITNCYNTGTVSGESYVGGVCGLNGVGIITNSYNTGTVSGTSSVGGVCGYIYSGTITNSYNTGAVSGTNYVGGVCGYNYGEISNCYSTGTILIGGDAT